MLLVMWRTKYLWNLSPRYQKNCVLVVSILDSFSPLDCQGRSARPEAVAMNTVQFAVALPAENLSVRSIKPRAGLQGLAALGTVVTTEISINTGMHNIHWHLSVFHLLWNNPWDPDIFSASKTFPRHLIEQKSQICFLVSCHLMQARESSSEVTIFIWLVGLEATLEFSSVQELNISVLKRFLKSVFLLYQIFTLR